MNQLMVTADDGPGLLARVYEAAAAANVEIDAGYCLANGATGLVTVSSRNEAGLRAALARAGLRFIAMEVVEVDDDPAARAGLFRRLTDAGVDLRMAVPVLGTDGRHRIALAARDHETLERALGR